MDYKEAQDRIVRAAEGVGPVDRALIEAIATVLVRNKLVAVESAGVESDQD